MFREQVIYMTSSWTSAKGQLNSNNVRAPDRVMKELVYKETSETD